MVLAISVIKGHKCVYILVAGQEEVLWVVQELEVALFGIEVWSMTLLYPEVVRRIVGAVVEATVSGLRSLDGENSRLYY